LQTVVLLKTFCEQHINSHNIWHVLLWLWCCTALTDLPDTIVTTTTAKGME